MITLSHDAEPKGLKGLEDFLEGSVARKSWHWGTLRTLECLALRTEDIISDKVKARRNFPAAGASIPS